MCAGQAEGGESPELSGEAGLGPSLGLESESLSLLFKIFIYVVAPGPASLVAACGIFDLHCSMQDLLLQYANS